MKIVARSNLADVLADLDALERRITDVALVRASNRLIAQAKTEGFRRISEIYEIGPRTMDTFASLKLSRSGDIEASITVKGSAFPLSAFDPIQTRKGVSVRIKGRRILIPHAFMVGRFGRRVFARGAYGGRGVTRASGETFGRFSFGRGRLPINQLYSLSPPSAFANDDVVEAMNDRVQSQAGDVLTHELAFAARSA